MAQAMDEIIISRYCTSSSVRLSEALFIVRFVERADGGPAKERNSQIYRHVYYGRIFDEIEAQEDPEPEKDGGPS